MAENKNTPPVKKNRYPIQSQLVGAHGSFVARIIKLGVSGFLVETETPLVVNDMLQAQFFMPNTTNMIDEQCTVVKTYDQHSGSIRHCDKIYYMSEISFRKPSTKTKALLEIFVKSA